MQLTVTTFLGRRGLPGPRRPRRGSQRRLRPRRLARPPLRRGDRQFIDGVFGQVDAFLLGRRTYDIFAASWPNATNPDDPLASPDNGIATGLAPDESRTTGSGVTISVYRPTGRPEFGEVEVS